jgi:hypothetical protein
MGGVEVLQSLLTFELNGFQVAGFKPKGKTAVPTE